MVRGVDRRRALTLVSELLALLPGPRRDVVVTLPGAVVELAREPAEVGLRADHDNALAHSLGLNRCGHRTRRAAVHQHVALPLSGCRQHHRHRQGRDKESHEHVVFDMDCPSRANQRLTVGLPAFCPSSVRFIPVQYGHGLLHGGRAPDPDHDPTIRVGCRSGPTRCALLATDASVRALRPGLASEPRTVAVAGRDS